MTTDGLDVDSGIDGPAIDGMVDAMPSAAHLGASTTGVDFGAVGVGMTMTRSVTITNSGDTATGALQVTVSGAQMADFDVNTTPCSGPLGAHASCVIGIDFTPGASGARAATLSVTSTPGGSLGISLAGAGTIVDDNITISPPSFNFGNAFVTETSAPQSFTVSNPGANPSGVPTVTLSGADFVLTNHCLTAIPAGGSCSVDVQARPQSVGAKAATLMVSAAPGGSTSASVAANALNPPTIVVSPDMHDFGSQPAGSAGAPFTFTVGNPLAHTATVVTVVSGPFEIVSNGCTMLAPAATCTIQVAFHPTALGAAIGTLDVSEGTPGTHDDATLSGTGIEGGFLTANPTTLDFQSVTVGATSAPKTVIITNAGASAIAGIAAGTSNSHFSLSSDMCTGMTLAAGAQCAIAVTYHPVAAGGETGTVTVAGTTGGSAMVAVSGTGAPVAGMLSVNPTAIDFGPVPFGQTSGKQTFTVHNGTTTTTTAPMLTIDGGDAMAFHVTANQCTSPLAPGADCNVVLSFEPVAFGTVTATARVTAAVGGAVQVSLMGTGAQPPPKLVIDPTTFDFGSVGIGAGAGAAFVITNPGTTDASLTAPSTIGPNAAEFVVGPSDCGTTLAAGASCSLKVTFTPTTVGARAAQLAIVASPQGTSTADLTGVGSNAPLLAISPLSADFGAQAVGAAGTTTKTFTVTNTALSTTSGALSVQVTGDTMDFSVADHCTNLTLAPQATCTLVVGFAPGQLGTRNLTLTVSGTPGGTVAASATGTGATPAHLEMTPSSFDFGAVSIFASAATTFTLSNTGGVTSGPPLVSITGSGDYSIQSSSCGSPLPQNGSCSITVRYAPTLGTHSAGISATASPGGAAGASVTGNGTL